MSIVGVSDVSLGYGSPQVPALLNELQLFRGLNKSLMLEPHQEERPERHEHFPALSMRRVGTRRSVHSRAGLLEYTARCAQILNHLRPTELVIGAPNLLPLLARLRYRPKTVFYYMLESLSYYHGRPGSHVQGILEHHRICRDLVDIVLFPEENRAEEDISLSGFADKKYAILYNAVNSAENPLFVEPSQRSRRILYSGTIERSLTFAEYFLDKRSAEFPFDLYGLIEGPKRNETRRLVEKSKNSFQYMGYIDNRTLATLRPTYAYAFISWNPLNPHLLNACPNKFFEAVHDGVVPIVAPHPQCRKIVEKYDCGILLRDWSYKAFREGVSEALEVFGTPRYAQLVENCRTAARQELNWQEQFKKVRWLLEKGARPS